MEEKFTFPKSEIIKVGRLTFRGTAFFNENSAALKPKIENLLRREVSSGNLNENCSQKQAV